MENTNPSRIVTVDLHVDAPWKWWKYGVNNRTKDHIDFPVYAVYLSDGIQDTITLELRQQVVRDQITWGHAEGVHQFGVEGGRLAEGMDLEMFARVGVKYVTITHNRNNELGDSATDTPRDGLTVKGIQFVDQLHRFGILPDISHVSDYTAYGVLECGEGIRNSPVIASHSGCRVLVDHPRNLSDRLIRSIGKSDGLIGIPFVKKFVGTALGSVADHIDHVAQLIGIYHVAIGSDIDGADTIVEAPEWRDVVINILASRGYSNEDIRAIAGGNARRVLGL
jgi:membrane dipeptidase